MKVQAKVIRRWKIGRLKENTRQADNFGAIPESELAALADDMRRRGQRVPIEVLPDGTVVAGHQRLRAAKRLGWTEIDVIVRYDLVGAGDDAVEAELIADNLYRRHLSPLARARSISRLLEIEEKASRGWLTDTGKEERKAKIAEQLHLSLRSVNRYLGAVDE